MLEALLAALREPLDALFGAEKRVFLPFLATSAAIAAVVWVLRVRPRGRTTLLGYLFPRRVWLHRSSLLDLQLIFARAILTAILFTPWFASTIAVAIAVARMLRKTFGVHPLDASRPVVAAVFTIVAFLADDLTRYAVHRALHRIPALWEIHKVHHSAEVLTPFTVQRVHPIEGFVNAARGILTFGAVTGIFIWLFPGRVRAWEILGVEAIGFLFAAAGANLRHSHVWLSYGRLERVLISPAQHQIHHSVDPRHHDKNFGAALSIWDWLFGTLYLVRARERLRFGLAEHDRNHAPNLLSALVGPCGAALRACVPARLRRPRATEQTVRSA
jgi:sterol desaturase/sphingolipid hydroxylase (fatty acid hydroxylase superfamily)